MSKPHKIYLDELLAWIEDDASHLLFASSTREGKQFFVKLKGGYVVTVDGRIVYDGTDGRTAVGIYNAVDKAII